MFKVLGGGYLQVEPSHVPPELAQEVAGSVVGGGVEATHAVPFQYCPLPQVVDGEGDGLVTQAVPSQYCPLPQAVDVELTHELPFQYIPVPQLEEVLVVPSGSQALFIPIW